MTLTLHTGPNLSGRSAALKAAAWGADGAAGGMYLYPNPVANFSGFARTVTGERFLHDIAHHQPGAGDMRARALIEDLPGDQRLMTLSGGQQARLALACAMAQQPPLLAIDGLLEQLDTAARAGLADALAGCPDAIHLSDNYGEPFATRAQSLIRHQPAADTPPVNAALATVGEQVAGTALRAPSIDLRDLTFRYPGGFPIFRSASFRFDPGNIYVLKAPNGAGKTTLARLLLGVEKPAGGTIFVDGQEHRAWRSATNLLFYAFQNPSDQLFGRTLGEYLATLDRIARQRPTFLGGALELDPAALIAATALGGFAEAEPFDLPWFIAKRASLAAGLLSRSPWLFLDEPALGSDADGRAAIVSLVRHLACSGLGIIVVSHGDEFDSLIDSRRITIRDGCIVTGGHDAE